MTILVTGGAGFIGSNFILDWFKHQDEPVINLDKLTYAGNLNNLASLNSDPRHQFVQSDINNKEKILALLNEHQVRAVIHFAAESHVDRSIAGPELFIETNVMGTLRLLEAVRAYLNEKKPAHFRFIHVSTDEVFGSLESNAPAFTELNRYEPNSPYSASKAASDHLVRAYYHTYGVPTITTNCSNNYGPSQLSEKLIPCVISHALAGKPIPIYGNGQQVRDWLYVSDHCTAIRTILDLGSVGEQYNIGGWNEKKNIDVVQLICAQLDLKRKRENDSYSNLIRFVEDRPGHDQRYAIDASKIALTLDWKPIETFATGLEKTVDWYLNHEEWLHL